jgi:dCTP deaminase
MLSAADIIAALKKPAGDTERLVITPLPELDLIEKRGGSSIDLRLGRWFRSFKQSQTTHVSLVGRSPANAVSEAARTKEHFVPFGDDFVLHPGRFVLGVTLEWLHLPKSMSGYVTGKSSLGRHGLVIETAAGIHPRFSGCLTLELANVGEMPLQIYPGMEICQIFLHETKPCDGTEPGKAAGQRKPTLPTPKPDPVFQKICRPPATAADAAPPAAAAETQPDGAAS